MKINDNLKLFWADNGSFLLKTIGIIFLVLSVIKTADYIVAQRIEQEEYENEINMQMQGNTVQIELIKKFNELCNERKTEEAYDLLSNKCKEEKYPTHDVFKEEFYEKSYPSKMNIKEMTYLGENNYKVILEEDMLSTGKTENLIKVENYIEINDQFIYIKSIL